MAETTQNQAEAQRTPNQTTLTWTLITMVLASSIVFLDGTVINVALPRIDQELSAGLSGLQWIVDSYLVTLAALLILGGSLGDHYGRKRWMLIGLIAFGIASVGCGLAPTTGWLIVARAAQGVAGALLVPEALAIITALFPAGEARGQAIGTWSAWTGIATVLGPLLGGWLVDTASWRWVFFINVPLIALAIFLLLRYVPETRDEEAKGNLDWLGATLLVVALAGLTYGLIEGPSLGWTTPLVLAGLVVGTIALVLFLITEARVENPMMPLSLFRSRTFSGANLATLGIYFALGGTTFFFVIYLQNVMGYSALQAGFSLLPISIIMFTLSRYVGKLAGRSGSRLFMTVGPLVVAAALLLLLRLQPDSNYWTVILPVALVLGAGLVITVAPLTTAVLSAAPAHSAGIASAINNVVSRIANLLAVALLGAVVTLTFNATLAGRAEGASPEVRAALEQAGENQTGAQADEAMPPEAAQLIAESHTVAFHRVMLICAVLAALGGAISFFTIRDTPGEVKGGEEERAASDPADGQPKVASAS